MGQKQLVKSYETYMEAISLENKFSIVDEITLEGTFFEKLHANSRGNFITSAYLKGALMKTYHFNKDDMRMNKFNAYFSLNTFLCPRRKKKYLYEYTCCFSDLDIRDVDISKEQALYLLENDYFGDIIPRPSYIIDSGRGFYLIWVFEDTIPARTKRGFNNRLFKKWTKVQKKIRLKLKDLGADPNALDVTRILRNTGTYNTKEGINEVKFIKEYPDRYSLNGLANEVLEYYNDDIKYNSNPNCKIQTAKKLELVSSHKKNTSSNFNLKKTNSNRVIDLEKFVELRHGDIEGYRELVLFLYRYHCCRSFGPKIAIARTFSLNNKFTNQFDEEYIVAATQTAEDEYLRSREQITEEIDGVICSVGYNYKTSTIIEALNMTESEQNEMLTLCNNTMKNNRKIEFDMAKRRNELGNTRRQQDKFDKVFHVQFLKEKNLNNVAISKITGFTKGTVSKYLKEICPSINQIEVEYLLEHELGDNANLITMNKSYKAS